MDQDETAPLPSMTASAIDLGDQPAALERRQTTRVECCYKALCQFGDDEYQASVINMGLGGMKFLCSQQFHPEDCLSMRQPDLMLPPVQVRVVWTRQQGDSAVHETGAVYLGPVDQLDSSWVKSALQRLGFEKAMYERRRHVRRRTNIRAKAHVGGQAHGCRVLDLGLGGALVESPRPIPQAQQGSPVGLEVEVQDALVLPARIVYLRHPVDGAKSESTRRYGLRFEEDQLTVAQARLVEGYLQAMS